jgi:trk system potassium uptake protein
VLRHLAADWVIRGRLVLLRTRRRRRTSLLAPAVGASAAAAGAGLLLAAVFDAAGDGRDVVPFVLCGLVLLPAGLGVRARFAYPRRLHAVQRCGALVAGWVALVVIAAAVYLLTGTFSRLDDALFESIAGLTTTSSTVLNPLEEAGDGILVFRSYTQWLGGLLGLFLSILVLPLALGGRELMTHNADRSAADGLAPDPSTGMVRITGAFGLGAVVLTALHLLVGLRGVDAVAHAFSTVASGGFSTRTGSVAAFDSAAFEWVTIAGMAVAGTSLVALWWGIRGATGALFRSTELRAYVTILGVSSALLCLWTGATDHDGVRRAIFTAVSAASTTGYRVADWDTWIPATQMLLILVVAVGAMSCSAGGGLRVVRLLGLLAQMRREVVRQRYPHAVQVAKVDRHAVEERTLDQMVGYEFISTLVVVATAFVVTALGTSFLAGVSLSVSALSTFGPGMDAGGAFADATALPRAARMALLPAMVLGRLAILPVLLLMAAGAERLGRPLRVRRHLVRVRSLR